MYVRPCPICKTYPRLTIGRVIDGLTGNDYWSGQVDCPKCQLVHSNPQTACTEGLVHAASINSWRQVCHDVEGYLKDTYPALADSLS